MTKLSKTQKMVLERIIAQVEKTRSKTLEEYLNEEYEDSYNKRVNNETYEEWFNEYGEWEINYYNGRITVYDVNKRTLAKLQEAGYIESIIPWYHNNEKIQVNLEKCGIK